MTQVEKIEATVGEDSALSLSLAMRNLGGQGLAREDLFLCRYFTHKKASINSCGVLLAQPTRRTTSEAAAFASHAASAKLAPAVSASVKVAATVSPAPLVSA